MIKSDRVRLTVVLATLLGGCTTVERNRLALALCNRTPGCTSTERQPESNGPPQVRAMENEKKERIINPKK